MDELELLRGLRSSGATAPAATIERARAQLARKIATDMPTISGGASGLRHVRRTTAASRPALSRRRLLLVSSAAAAVVAGFVAADVISVDGAQPPGAAMASAAEVLEKSAVSAITTSDPVVGPGQYLKVDVKAVVAAIGTDAEGGTFAWLESQDHIQYIPADRSQVWIWDRSSGRRPIQFMGADSEAYYAQLSAADDPTQNARMGIDPDPIWRADGGAWFGSPQRILDMPLEEGLAALPRDPEALLARIRAYNGDTGQSRDGQVLETVRTILTTQVVPADLRAALYRTLTLVPGVTVAEREATLDGRTGVAIGRVETAGGQQRRDDIIIDPETGQFIGQRTVTLIDQERFPAGTTTAWTAVTLTVVDSAP